MQRLRWQRASKVRSVLWIACALLLLCGCNIHKAARERVRVDTDVQASGVVQGGSQVVVVVHDTTRSVVERVVFVFDTIYKPLSADDDVRLWAGRQGVRSVSVETERSERGVGMALVGSDSIKGEQGVKGSQVVVADSDSEVASRPNVGVGIAFVCIVALLVAAVACVAFFMLRR